MRNKSKSVLRQEVRLTGKQFIGLLYGLGEPVQNESLVLAWFGVQFVPEELDDVGVLYFASFLVLGLLYLIQELLGVLCLPIIILLVLGISSPGQSLLSKY